MAQQINELTIDESTYDWRQDHARRYLEARYGKNVWFKAPETFGNVLERWLWACANNSRELAEESVKAIEAHYAEERKG